MADGTGVTVGILGILQRRISAANAFHLGLGGYALCGSQSALLRLSLLLLAILVLEQIQEYLLHKVTQ